MKNRFLLFNGITRIATLSLLVTGLTVGSMHIAQAQQDSPRRPGRPPNPLGFLKHALEESSAPALTTQQEEQLTQLVTSFRESRAAQTPNEAGRTVHEAYDAAILAGDEAAAQTQAITLANAIAAQNVARLKAEASFKIVALGVLSSEQKTALGTNFLPRVLNTLAGGPGGPGGPAKGPGRMGPANGSAPNPAIRRRPGN